MIRTKQILTLIVLLACSMVAHAQVSTSVVSGTFLTSAGAANPKARLTILRGFKDGQFLQGFPQVKTANNSGVITATLIRGAQYWIYQADDVRLSANGTAGVLVTIPDAPTATWDSLVISTSPSLSGFATSAQLAAIISDETGSGPLVFNTSPTFLTQITTPKVVWSGSVIDTSGSGDPEGVITASIGSIYRRTNGSTGTTIYFKESGTGNTGWVAVGSGGGGGANAALSNLASVAINTSLISDANNTDDLGSSGNKWRTGYFGTSIVNLGISTLGNGTFTGAGVPSGVDSPTVLSVAKGTSVSTNTSTSPVVSISDVFSGDPADGAGRVSIHTTLYGAASGDVETLSVTARQAGSGAVSTGGLIAGYFRTVAEIVGTNSSHFGGAASAQWWVRGDNTSWEFDIDNQAGRAISGATNANPIVITTTAAHTFVNGDKVTISGVGGNTAANVTDATVTVLSSTTFSIPVTGNGAYTSGGTVALHAADDYGTAGARSQGVIIAGVGLGKHTAALVVDSQGGATSAFKTGLDIRPNSIDTTTARAISIPNATNLYSWNFATNARVQIIGLNASDQVSIASGGGATVIGGTLAVTGDTTVPDEAYGSGWNGSLEVPTKNALWDKIETISGGSGANTALSNLASVAINTSLLSDTDNTDALGSAAKRWTNVFATQINPYAEDNNILIASSGGSLVGRIQRNSGTGGLNMVADAGELLLSTGGSAEGIKLVTANTNKDIELSPTGNVVITAGRLNIGGSTSSFPSLKRSTTKVQFRLADDSAYAPIEVLDEAYGSGWNGSNEVPTKNALWDKIETLGAGSGTVSSATADMLGYYSGTGTTISGRTINDFTADGSPDGAADYVLTWDASASLHKKVLINNLPSGGSVTASSTTTFTNKTIDVEATGNVFIQPITRWLPMAGCNNASASTLWDLPTSNAPTPACDTGSNTQKAVLDFPDVDGDYTAQITERLPAGTTGQLDASFLWKSATATTGNLVLQLQTTCVADGETGDPAWNTASTVTDTAKGTVNQANDASITNVTITGCAAGELLHLRVLRNRTHASDTIAGTIRLIGLEYTIRTSR